MTGADDLLCVEDAVYALIYPGNKRLLFRAPGSEVAVAVVLVVGDLASAHALPRTEGLPELQPLTPPVGPCSEAEARQAVEVWWRGGLQ